MIEKNLNKQYNDKGYFKVDKIFSEGKLKEIEKDIIKFANLFQKKINNKKFKKNIDSVKTLDLFFKKLESYNKQYLFNFVNLINKMPSILNLVNNDKILNITSKILKEDKRNLLLQNPSFLVNMPKNKRILYHWHNAKNSYPKRNLYLNFWAPIISNKKSNNGTLCVAERSHKKEYPFLEFKKMIGEKERASALSQYLIPENFIRKFKKTNIIADKGSCLAMHPNLVHSSTLNKTKNNSYVLVFKIWSISKDWTLSSNINQKYFDNDSGAGSDIKII